MAAFGQKKGKSMEAHEHGAAKLDIAVEGKKAVIEFEAPAESIVGFEHKASSASDKQKHSAALELFKAQVSNMVIFDSSAGCKFTTEKLEVAAEDDDHHAAPPAKSTAKSAAKSSKGGAAKEAEHSEVRAKFSVACTTALEGTKVRFGFTKVFPRIQSVAVQALSGSQPVGAEIKKDQGIITLGR